MILVLLDRKNIHIKKVWEHHWDLFYLDCLLFGGGSGEGNAGGLYF